MELLGLPLQFGFRGLAQGDLALETEDFGSLGLELFLEPGKDGFAVRRIPPPAGTPVTEINGVLEAGGLLIDGGAIWSGCGLSLCRLEKGEKRYRLA